MNPAETGSDAFTDAVQRLMSRAPGPVFPRARRLYFDKYPLEAAGDGGDYRTFLLEETITEGDNGILSIVLQAFALVPWDPDGDSAAPGRGEDLDAAARYLWERWGQRASAIRREPGPWFRSEAAFLRLDLTATYCNRAANDPDLRAAES